MTERAASPTSAIVSPAEMVAYVRDTFCLEKSEMADIYGVSRPTIYEWEKLKKIDADLHDSYKSRIKNLYRISMKWRDMGKIKGDWLHKMLMSGKSVLDLLKASTLDENAIASAHQQLSALQPVLLQREADRGADMINALGNGLLKMDATQKKRRQ